MRIVTSKTLESRRGFLRKLAAAGAFYTTTGLFAEALTLTPQCTQGPYYPLAQNIPLDKDNDLVQLNDSLTPAAGIITYVSGRVLDSSGHPIRGALVEIWHADDGGNYTYSSGSARNPSSDPHFAGFGQFLTGSSGAYKFRTIKAGLYVGRTRHYHFGITIPGQLARFTTQLFWNEVPKAANGSTWGTTNDNDMVLQGITDADRRASVIKDYTAVPGSTSGEVQTIWDIVMGLTPMYPPYPGGGSLLITGTTVPGPTNSVRFQLSIPVYANYTYEVYGNPTLADLAWSALPFSLTQNGTVSTNKFTAASDGTLNLFLEQKAVKGFYYVSFRVPGANTGTP
jgi:protocatechuate 3,4-dioxygenase beta subunit